MIRHKNIKCSRLGLWNTPIASLQRGKIALANECPRYDIKQSDGETLALEIWRMQSTLSLPLLPGQLRVVVLDWVLSMSQIE